MLCSNPGQDWLQPVKLRLKIDLVSYPAQTEGLGKYDNVVFFFCFKFENSIL